LQRVNHLGAQANGMKLFVLNGRVLIYLFLAASMLVSVISAFNPELRQELTSPKLPAGAKTDFDYSLIES
jgi:hypothetical protein